jgi:hypothetical protein
MNFKILSSLLIVLTSISFLTAQVKITTDTVYIPGGTIAGGENAGIMETTINDDTTAGGEKIQTGFML